MGEQVPSKEPVYCTFCGISNLEHLDGVIVQALTANICNKCISTSVQVLAEHYASTAAENAKLKTTLRGIQSCSTCEACRGAATRALGDPLPAETRAATSRGAHSTEDAGRPGPSDIVEQMRLAGYHDWATAVERLERRVDELSTHAEKWVKRALERAAPDPAASIRELAASAYKDGHGEDLSDDRDLSARTHELMRQLSRPAHEREPPHCSTCGCGIVHAPACRVHIADVCNCGAVPLVEAAQDRALEVHRLTSNLGQVSSAYVVLRLALLKITPHRLRGRKTQAALIAEEALEKTANVAAFTPPPGVG